MKVIELIKVQLRFSRKYKPTTDTHQIFSIKSCRADRQITGNGRQAP
ncbi:MAG: hypothetical protein HGA56_06725 [Chlorobiaceae bacterium]|nr:hypothetical protein [Chlorobiaceae bacterium]